MIYIVSFCLSIIFLNIGLKQENKKIKFIFEMIGLLIPCILAGMRSINIGTDTKGYPFKLYSYVGEGYSFSELVAFSDLWYLSVDYLYLLITYFFGHFHFSFQMYLFILECLMIFPYYYALKNGLKEKNSILIGMLLFYLTFYNLSLNMIRQSIAISFVMLSFSILKNKDLIKTTKKRYFISMLVLIIGYLFHDTALIILPFYLMYLFFQSKKIGKNQKQMASIFIVFSFLLLLFLHKPLLHLISVLGLYNKIDFYINSFTDFNIDFTGTILNILIIFFIVHEKKEIRVTNDEYLFALTISFCNLLMSFLGTFIKYSHRISYYLFFMLLSCYIPLAFKTNKNLDNRTKYLRILIILVFFIDWIIVIYTKNANETIPYEFFFNK